MQQTLIRSALVALVVCQAAAAASLSPGTYITEGGWGELAVRKAAGGGLEFEIESMGANAHVCGLGGAIVAGRATLDTFENETCRVDFTATADGIEVAVHEDDRERCRYFCGARAGFEGSYLAVPGGCLPAEVQATRDRFKKLYDARQYAPAAAVLDALLPQCGRLLMDIDQGWIESDLAITRLKLGDRAGCRAALEGRSELAAMSEDEIAENYPPVEAELYGRLAKAVRTNLKLCAETAQPGSK